MKGLLETNSRQEEIVKRVLQQLDTWRARALAAESALATARKDALEEVGIVAGHWELTKRDIYRDPQTGELAGIQESSQLIFVEDGSSKCPVCGVDIPHSHGLEDLKTLYKKIAYLTTKLGIRALAQKDKP